MAEDSSWHHGRVHARRREQGSDTRAATLSTCLPCEPASVAQARHAIAPLEPVVDAETIHTLSCS
jgi:hypothetical protein